MTDEERPVNPLEPEEPSSEGEAFSESATGPEQTQSAEQADEGTEPQPTEVSQPGGEREEREAGSGAEELPPSPGPTPSSGSFSEDVSNDDRLMAGLAWLGLAILQIPLVSLVLLIAEENKKRLFQRFHAINSLLFWVVGFVYEIMATVVYLVLAAISGGCLGCFLWIIFFLPHIIALYYAYVAYQGRSDDVPVLTDLARNQGWL